MALRAGDQKHGREAMGRAGSGRHCAGSVAGAAGALLRVKLRRRAGCAGCWAGIGGGAHRGLGLFEGESCEPGALAAIALRFLACQLGPGRLAAVSELLRTGGIRLYNKNRALRRSMRDVDAM